MQAIMTQHVLQDLACILDWGPVFPQQINLPLI